SGIITSRVIRSECQGYIEAPFAQNEAERPNDIRLVIDDQYFVSFHWNLCLRKAAGAGGDRRGPGFHCI
ncbi:MAG TPA: hypothetical protein DHW65_01850, partial [Dehalococcoidia bacterium]|nr:hypothetical protein [Dehalococcoidia bacterium]